MVCCATVAINFRGRMRKRTIAKTQVIQSSDWFVQIVSRLIQIALDATTIEIRGPIRFLGPIQFYQKLLKSLEISFRHSLKENVSTWKEVATKSYTLINYKNTKTFAFFNQFYAHW